MSIDFPKEEERILKRWDEIDAFLTQVELVCFRMPMFGWSENSWLTCNNSPKAKIHTLSTMDRPLPQECLITAIYWPRPSRTSFHDTGP